MMSDEAGKIEFAGAEVFWRAADAAADRTVGGLRHVLELAAQSDDEGYLAEARGRVDRTVERMIPLAAQAGPDFATWPARLAEYLELKPREERLLDEAVERVNKWRKWNPRIAFLDAVACAAEVFEADATLLRGPALDSVKREAAKLSVSLGEAAQSVARGCPSIVAKDRLRAAVEGRFGSEVAKCLDAPKPAAPISLEDQIEELRARVSKLELAVSSR